MNCAVCGTPRSENEDSCLFCGAKFPEVNMDQGIKNYIENNVVSFGEEKEEDEFDIDGFLQNDLDLDKILSDIEDINNDYTTDTTSTEDESGESIDAFDDENFDFSIDDLSDIEKMLGDDTFTVEEVEAFESAEKPEAEVSFVEEVDFGATGNETLAETILTAEELDLITSELFGVGGLGSFDDEITKDEVLRENNVEAIEEVEEEVDFGTTAEALTNDSTGVTVEDDLTELDLDWIAEDDLTEDDLDFIAEEILKEDLDFNPEDFEPISDDIFGEKDFEPIADDIFGEKEFEPIADDIFMEKDIEPKPEDIIVEQDLDIISDDIFGEKEIEPISDDIFLEKDTESMSEDITYEQDLDVISDNIFGEIEPIAEDVFAEQEIELIAEELFTEKVIQPIAEDMLPEQELESISEAVLSENHILEEKAEVESTDVELFTEDELEFLNDRVKEVHENANVENDTLGSSSAVKKPKKNEEFDFSLEDLENIEKDLSTGKEKTSSTLSMLEEALLSGQDVRDIDVKGVLAGESKIESEDDENLASKKLRDTSRVRAMVSTEEILPFAMYEKIRNALVAKENGEILDYVLSSKDNRDDDQILREAQARISLLANSQVESSEDLGEELLELEQMLLARDKEKNRVIGVIEDVEDIDDADIDFVEVEDIDDEDNFVKLTADDRIQNDIDNLVKNFRDSKDKIVKEGEEQEEVVAPTTEDLEEAVEEDLDELERIDREILKAKKSKEEAETRAKQMDEIDSALSELDSLISDVIGDLPDLEAIAKAKKLAEEAPPAPSPEAPTKIEKTLYDKELVKEYETLRLDLELFFPGTQALDHLDQDIEELLQEDELGDLIEQLESEVGIDFDGFDFEELTDRDISDALLDIRDMQDHVDKKRLEERRKKRAARRKKINSVLTLGDRVKVYDTGLLLVCLITAIVLAVAWISTVNTQNLSVNMQTKSEQLEVANQLWDGLYDIATKYDNIQGSLEGYTKGEIDTNKVTFELSNLIDETIITRQAFERVDLPTYSEYKFRIDEFLSRRMLLASQVLKDIEEGKTESEAITEFLNVETDFSTFEDVKKEFYRQLNLIN